jgi:hypothetical protein
MPITRRLCALLAIGLLIPGMAASQQWEDYDYENLEFRGIGLDIGSVWPNGIEPTLAFGVRADMGFVGPRVRVAPAIRYWTSRLEDAEVSRLSEQLQSLCEQQASGPCPDFNLGEIDRSDLELAADAHYLIPTGYTIEPYVGGGLGIHLLNGSGEAIEGTFVEDLLDTVVPALNLVGGVNIPIGTLVLIGEARYVLVSDVRYGHLLVGGTWTLPSPPISPFR